MISHLVGRIRDSVLPLAVGISVAFVFSPQIAAAHSQLLNSVDSSTSPAEIRYTESSKYDDAITNAINKWNALPGGVTIAPDTSSTVNDLEISDLNSNDTWHGRWVWNVLADNINFNTRILDGSTWTNTHRRKTALHEFGHAHGFGHNDLAWPSSIMRQGMRAQDTLGDHDKTDYASKWG